MFIFFFILISFSSFSLNGMKGADKFITTILEKEHIFLKTTIISKEECQDLAKWKKLTPILINLFLKHPSIFPKILNLNEFDRHEKLQSLENLSVDPGEEILYLEYNLLKESRKTGKILLKEYNNFKQDNNLYFLDLHEVVPNKF